MAGGALRTRQTEGRGSVSIFKVEVNGREVTGLRKLIMAPVIFLIFGMFGLVFLAMAAIFLAPIWLPFLLASIWRAFT